MKLFDQPYIPSPVPSTPAQTPSISAPVAPSYKEPVTHDSSAGGDLIMNKGSFKDYPMATEGEIQPLRAGTAALRGRHGGGGHKPPAGGSQNPPATGGNKPPAGGSQNPPATGGHKPPATGGQKPPTTGGHKPPPKKYPGGSNGPAAAAARTNDINDLHQKNAFPPISSLLASSARNALITAGVSTLVGIPFNVGEHIASKAITDRIDAQSKMPGAEVKNPDGTKTTVDPSATQAQKLEARLESSEIKTEVFVNNILSINEGLTANAVGKAPDATTDTDTEGRLTGLEHNMGWIEGQMDKIATRYGLIYDPYIAPESSEAPTENSRMANIEQRYAHMNKMMKRLILAKQADTADDE